MLTFAAQLSPEKTPNIPRAMMRMMNLRISSLPVSDAPEAESYANQVRRSGMWHRSLDAPAVSWRCGFHFTIRSRRLSWTTRAPWRRLSKIRSLTPLRQTFCSQRRSHRANASWLTPRPVGWTSTTCSVCSGDSSPT